MKIAIHFSEHGFSRQWIGYCEEKKIDYKIVDCYRNDIISQLSDCDALMWHIEQSDVRDILFAKQLLFSVKASGKRVFPDFDTSWHFDDKVGQKYLLEAIQAPLVPTYVFYERNDALAWADKAKFPKVFKLRSGAGSANVKLIRSKRTARRVINKAFGRGFSGYDSIGGFREKIRKFFLGKESLWQVLRSCAMLFFVPRYCRVSGRECGYIYFQDFVPNNTFDVRVIVIGSRAFAIKRMVRKNDFRASGSGEILYEKKHFNDETIRLAFKISEKLGSQCMAYDFVYHNGQPLVIEISYGFVKKGYDPCTGYWDKDLAWHEGSFNPQGWMVEEILK